MITKNPYEKTLWFEDIVDPVTHDVLEEGTPFMSEYANNIEEGIYGSYEYLIRHDKDIQRLRVQMELDGRAPGNNGSFSDTLADGAAPSKMTRLTASADIVAVVEAGETEIPVDTVVGFVVFTEVTVFDGSNSEDVMITAVGVNSLTVQALTNAYVKGARVARSTVTISDGQMTRGDWGTYSVSLMEVV